MGTTATSLHILSLPSDPASLSGEIERAYRKLGYAKPKKPGAAPARQVVLVPGDDGGYLSIYDSENDEIDSGADLLALQAEPEGDLAGVIALHAGSGIDRDAQDLLGVLGRNLLDLHAAIGRGHHRDAGGRGARADP